MRGRPSKSKEEHDLHGDPGKRHKSDSKSDTVDPDCRFVTPIWLPKRLIPKLKQEAQYLADNRISKVSNHLIWERYCHHVFLEDKAFRALKKEPLITSRDKNKTKNPLLMIHKDNSAMALKYAEQLGLTPLARMKIKGKPSKSADPLGDFINKGDKLRRVK